MVDGHSMYLGMMMIKAWGLRWGKIFTKESFRAPKIRESRNGQPLVMTYARYARSGPVEDGSGYYLQHLQGQRQVVPLGTQVTKVQKFTQHS